MLQFTLADSNCAPPLIFALDDLTPPPLRPRSPSPLLPVSMFPGLPVYLPPFPKKSSTILYSTHPRKKEPAIKDKLLIYGANGYTGDLTARVAAKQGLQPILAGRNKAAVTAIAEQLGFEARIFSLDDGNAIEAALDDVGVLLHCAGPFTKTAHQMAAACLDTGTHYLDITGEIEVYAALYALDAQAKQAGVMLLPGAGFDVVPSDCLAAYLKTKLPAATKLALAFRNYGPASLSRGTALTSIQNLGQPSYVRRDGKLTPVPHLSKSRQVDFGRGPVTAQRVIWGDIYTAYHSTGIPNIENYMAASGGLLWMLRLARSFGWLLRIGAFKRLLSLLPRLMPPGPTDEQIERSGAVLWGEVQDDQGNRALARLNAPEAYYLTALTSLAIAQKVLSGDAPTGYQTPASAYGPDWILEIEGVSRVDV